MQDLRTLRRRGLAVVGGLLLGVTVYVVLGGRFSSPEHALPANPDVVELPERRLRVVEAPGLRSGPTVLPTAAPHPAAGMSVRLVVQGEAGAPLGRATVYWTAEGEVLASETTSLVGTTSESGVITVAIDDVPLERTLVVRAEGWLPEARARSELRAALKEPGSELLIKLARGKTCGGRVVDCWGKPVAGASVHGLGRFGMRLRHDSKSLPGLRAAYDLATCTSGEDGAWNLMGVREFPIGVRARKEGYTSFGPLQAVDSSSEALNLILYPYLRVGLRVVDAASGDQLRVYEPGMTTPDGLQTGRREFAAASGNEVRDGYDPASGATWWTLRVTGAPLTARLGGSVRLHARAPGFVPGSVDVSLASLMGASPSNQHEIKLDRVRPTGALSLLKVKVSCPVAPQPLRYFYVRVRATDPALRNTENRMRQFGGTAMYVPLKGGGGSMPLPPGQYDVALEASSEWLWWEAPRKWHTVTVASGGATVISLEIPAGALRVRVLDRAGSPIPGATLGAGSAARARMFGSLDLDYALGSEGYRRRRELHKMAPGEVTLLMAPGRYVFVGSAPGYAVATGLYELRDGERATLVVTLIEE